MVTINHTGHGNCSQRPGGSWVSGFLVQTLSSQQIPAGFGALHQELIPLLWPRLGWRQKLRVGPSTLALLPEQLPGVVGT